jgi:hypothetical protein
MSTLAAPRPPQQTSRPARKPLPRRIAVVQGLRGANAGVVRIAVGKKVDHYAVARLDVPVGSAWELRKYGADGTDDPYHAFLSGEESSCDCAGGSYVGRCKHLDGLLALAARGLI